MCDGFQRGFAETQLKLGSGQRIRAGITAEGLSRSSEDDGHLRQCQDAFTCNGQALKKICSN